MVTVMQQALRAGILASVMTMAVPAAAHADMWKQCEVMADVQETPQPGVFLITVQSAEVEDGDEGANIGAPCLTDRIGRPRPVEVAGDPPIGRNETLTYDYHKKVINGIPIVIETWTVPSLIERLF